MYNKSIIFLSFASILASILLTGFLKYSLVLIFTVGIFSLKNFKLDIKKHTGRIIIFYILYILFEILSLIIENTINEVIFAKILARHFVTILILLNLSCLHTYNFNYVLRLYFIFTMISCLGSILQFIQFDFALDLYKILYPDNTSYEASELSLIVENNFSFYGYPGLYENVVLSAQYSSTFLMFSFFYFKKNKFLTFFFVLIFITALLLMQVRSGIYSSLFVLLGFIFFFHRKYFLIAIIPLLIYATITINSLITTTKLRMLNTSSPIRDLIDENFWNYVGEGNILGKREYFANRNYFLKNQNITTPHNILKNAYVLSGLPGFLITLIIILKIIFYKLKESLSLKHHFVHKAAIFCYLVSSFTHNNSFHFGDSLMFIILLSHEKN